MDCEMSSWTSFLKSSDEYQKGVEEYLDHAFSTRVVGDQISCPCEKCYHRFWHRRDEVYNHLIANGFRSKAEAWYFLEKGQPSMLDTHISVDEGLNVHDQVDRLVYDTHRDVVEQLTGNDRHINGANQEEDNKEAKKFFKLVEDGKQELYPGCKTFSKLSFLIRLYLFKCVHRLSNGAFSELLEILRELIPEAKLPKSFNEAKKLVKDLGLHYEKIDACRNDCMLYWKEYKGATSCHICQAPRWKALDNKEEIVDNNSGKKDHKVPAKVVWHFPLKPRLQRLYMCSETSEYMRWHDEKRPKDKKLRHPADGKAWVDFDIRFQEFAKDARNVRLGLASDGFNPFRTMSTTHSTWPVVLLNYNLPPWLFMKSEYLMLSLLIPGPTSPGNDIDVYLQPLVEELKDLWELGLDTYDASKSKTFKMYAALQSTTSDFPGYAMLSGWSTKGKFACPYCHYETDHLRLKHSKKSCYMGHRRFLDANHPLRLDKKSFNGAVEERASPDPLTGTQVLTLLRNLTNDFGKKLPKKKTKDCPFKKRSIFYNLAYWKYNGCRHHLDVMHIEKNICDSLIGTLLDLPGKTKDHVNARRDLKEMGIRASLQPVESNDKRHLFLPKAAFSLSKEEKTIFCEVLKKVKLPQGCGSDISRRVHVKERKIFGYKSHDAHILMQYLLQVAVRKTLPKHVAFPLVKLGAFFRGICSKVVDLQELDRLETEITETLCQLERIFPPAFFDIMVHLPVHLVNEVRLGGPVSAWWMYGIERYLGKLKSYVGNRSRPEGSIAEGYLAEECLVFCSRYLRDGKRKRSKGNKRGCDKCGVSHMAEVGSSLFQNLGYPLGRKKKGKKGVAISLDTSTMILAHRYVLFNCHNEQVEKYISEHQEMTRNISKDKRRKRWRGAQQHSHEFMDWFREKMESNRVHDDIKWLSLGPSTVARKYSGYSVNGYKFFTKERDDKLRTQNSGVTLNALTSCFSSTKDHNPITSSVTYYGVVQEIIEIDYWSAFKVTLFRCDWFHVEKDEYGLTCVNFKKLCYTDDPFVLASQVRQVFYVEDGTDKGVHYVMSIMPKVSFDDEGQGECAYMVENGENVNDKVMAMVDDSDISWCKDGEPDTVENCTTSNQLETDLDYEDDDSDYDDTDWDWMEPMC